MLAYDPVFLYVGDSNVLTQGDDTNANTLAAAWAADPKIYVANNTLAGAWEQYAIGNTGTPTVGRTGLNYSANKNNPGPEIGFIPKFRAAWGNDLRFINLSAPGSYMGRGSIKGTCTGYVAGNVFTLSTGTMPDAGTLITGSGIPAGTVLASFGTGGSTRYVYTAGVSGFGLSFTAGSSGAPITVTKYGYAYSLSEGTLWSGTDASITNGYKTRTLNALAALVTAGKNPKIPSITILIGTNDMSDTTAASFFSAAMSGFIAELKSSLASYLAPDFKIILVQAKTGAAGSTVVRAAQASIVSGDAACVLLGTDGAAFTLSDGTHYTCPTAPQVYTGRAAIGSTAYDLWAAFPPGATGTLSASSPSDSTMQLAFTDASGATSHEYRINGGAATALAGNKIVTGLTASTAYDFEVRGVNGVGSGAWSNVANASTQAGAPPVAIFSGGTMDSTTGWNAYYGGSAFGSAPVGGKMVVTANGGEQYNANSKAFDTNPTAGKYYEVSVDLVFTSGSLRVDFNGGTTASSATFNTNGTKVFRLLANSGNTTLALLLLGASGTNNLTIDNLSVVGPYDTP